MVLPKRVKHKLHYQHTNYTMWLMLTYVRTCSIMSKHVQLCSNMFHYVQTCLIMFKHVQLCSFLDEVFSHLFLLFSSWDEISFVFLTEMNSSQSEISSWEKRVNSRRQGWFHPGIKFHVPMSDQIIFFSINSWQVNCWNIRTEYKNNMKLFCSLFSTVVTCQLLKNKNRMKFLCSLFSTVDYCHLLE